MGERIYINDLNPINNIQGGSSLLVDQQGYRKISYSDFVVDIVDTVKSDFNLGWNATIIDGSDISVESPQSGDTILYNASTSRFENRKIDASEIDWSNIDVNEHKFLHVDHSGTVVQKHIQIPSLRMDNSYSSNFFLRVTSDGERIEAVDFDPNEFTINAQTIEGNSLSDLDVRYMRGGNNLSELTNTGSARDTLGVISETESDNRYVSKSQNLNDLNNKATAFTNIKQNATTAYSGVIEIATSAEVQLGDRSDIAVVPSTLKDNYRNKADSDSRYMRRSNNLSDVANINIARDTLGVYSRTESDSRYLQKGLNLSELTSKSVARDNLEVYDKQYIDQYTLVPTNNLSDVDNVSQARNNIDVYSRSEVDALINNIVGVPTGTIIAFPANAVPNGFLKCNGAQVSRNSYTTLFSVIGSTYGNGNNYNTFNLPDLRGEFIRGWDDGRGVDNNRNLGYHQGESTKRHYHGTGKFEQTVNDDWYAILGNWDGTHRARWVPGESGFNSTKNISGGSNSRLTRTTEAQYITAANSETRPRNYAMLFCIKY